MEPRIPRDAATSNVMAWGVPAANMLASSEEEAAAEADEPPELQSPKFVRTSIRKHADRQPSLLTKALQKESEDESSARHAPGLYGPLRRRSVNSNVSLASTAELTSDTGITSPARTNTPSPPPVELRLVPMESSKLELPAQEPVIPTPAVPEPQAKEEPIKRRTISFACMGKPGAKTPPAATTPTTQAAAGPKIVAPAPRRPCIKFACATKPGSEATKPRLQTPPPPALTVTEAASTPEPSSSATIRKARSPSHNGRISPGRAAAALRTAQSPMRVKSKRYLEASSNDLQYESSRFHEFASDEPQEDDWIRRDSTVAKAKITINDTLLKENRIRRIGREAEEEAELEEQDDDEEREADDGENEDDEDGNDVDKEEEEDELDQGWDNDEFSGYDSDDDVSDGYHQDEECGFADSGDEEGDDDGFWTPSRAMHRSSSVEAAFSRRPDMTESHSDSSAVSASHLKTMRRHKAQRIKIRPGTPELPDSTDFVCGTFDEDRPLEDAYLSCMAQKKREKLRIIPQDIDPSFPTSDPEDEAEERFNPVHHGSDDDHWMHGDMEDIHHEQERGRKKNGGRISPRRFHSPPPKQALPKRLQSPAPKNRGRSPVPAQPVGSPTAFPAHGGRVPMHLQLGGRPDIAQVTKSLPRDQALFPQMRGGPAQKKGKMATANPATTTRPRPGHVRGAIDIVKGLEQKRQRRKEKYYQKYCDRARKGQIPVRRPLVPGHGAERMRELGLLMAGKVTGHGSYVLSV